jgi:hypothetical protein
MRRHILFLLIAATVGIFVACSNEDSHGGTSPPDGASGVCCPPSTGGCAKIGGYRESGDCAYDSICDNMCEQRIVDDVHGCKKMVYRNPPVTTTYAGTESCSDPIFNGGRDSGRDSAADADAARDADAGD